MKTWNLGPTCGRVDCLVFSALFALVVGFGTLALLAAGLVFSLAFSLLFARQARIRP